MNNRNPSNLLNQTLRLAGVVQESIVDGPGIRYVVFTQGCLHRCPGCHNPESHDPMGGMERPISILLEEIKKNPLLKGVTFSGGEPFMQPMPLATLGKAIKEMGLDLIVYSGYTFEELWDMAGVQPQIMALLSACDILVDGRFIEKQRDIELSFRGSGNQRVIDLPASLASGRAVETQF